MQRFLLALVLVVFAILSAAAMWQHGYVGIFAWQLANTAGLQVLAGLGIALTLILVWLWRDARVTGRNPWLWTVLTLAAGSFGPLLYLLFRGAPRAQSARTAATRAA